jgi:hypothetical protein
MKKNTPYIIIIVILLVIIVIGTIYIVNDKKTSENETNTGTNEKTTNTVENKIELKNTTKVGNKVTEEYELSLNGKTQNLNVEFVYENAEDYLKAVRGTLNGMDILYYLELVNQVYANDEEFENKSLEVTLVNYLFNENNFKIIKGTDGKYYLGIVADFVKEGQNSYLYIFNDSLEQVNDSVASYLGGTLLKIISTENYELQDDVEPWYSSGVKLGLNEYDLPVLLKIEDDKIYNFALASAYDCGAEDGTMEERVYTINNNKLEYTTINTYKITGLTTGQC